MGFAIKITYNWDYYTTYFVQGAIEREATEKAYKMFRDTTTRYTLPESMADAIENEVVYIEVLAEIDQIIL